MKGGAPIETFRKRFSTFTVVTSVREKKFSLGSRLLHPACRSFLSGAMGRICRPCLRVCLPAVLLVTAPSARGPRRCTILCLPRRSKVAAPLQCPVTVVGSFVTVLAHICVLSCVWSTVIQNRPSEAAWSPAPTETTIWLPARFRVSRIAVEQVRLRRNGPPVGSPIICLGPLPCLPTDVSLTKLPRASIMCTWLLPARLRVGLPWAT